MPAPYPLEFRREAVVLLKRSGKSVPVLARELGISPQSLRNWARQIDRTRLSLQRRAAKAQMETAAPPRRQHAPMEAAAPLRARSVAASHDASLLSAGSRG